jgi:hypothetical protein
MNARTISNWVMGLALLSAGHVIAAISAGPDCVEKDLRKAVSDIHGTDANIFVESSYVGPWIQVDNKTLHIIGGMKNCDQVTVDSSGTRSSLVGETGDEHTLLGISGSSGVDLKNFSLSSGRNEGYNGGGISFASSGAKGHLELHHVDIGSSAADRGGAIYRRPVQLQHFCGAADTVFCNSFESL